MNTDIINCYGTKLITFNCNIIKPLDLTNFVSLKKIKYPSNIELIQFPDGLEEIEFGIEFNSSIDNLPPNIKKIIFYPDSKFNQPLIKFFDGKNFYEAPENNVNYFLG